jgi:hypothetical protein
MGEGNRNERLRKDKEFLICRLGIRMEKNLINYFFVIYANIHNKMLNIYIDLGKNVSIFQNLRY